MKINCWECGACCKLVGIAVENAKYFKAAGIQDLKIIEPSEFPYEYDKTGRCSMLDINNKCTIYDTRPDICRADVTYEKHYKIIMSETEYIEKAEVTCKDLEKLFKTEDIDE